MRWLLLGAVIVALALVFGRKGQSEVRVPTDPNEVLQHVASSSTSGRELKSLEQAALAAPDDPARAAAAAKKAIELARREADPRYWGRAQAALQPWWSAPHPPDDVLELRAVIRQASGDLDGARADLELLPSPEAKRRLADLERITGHYEQSRAACGADLECSALLDSLTGHAREAKAALEGRPASLAQGEVDERAGDDAAAERTYRAAEAWVPLADLLLATGRAGEVDALLSSRFSDDAALVRLALAESKKLGRPGPYAQMLRWRLASISLRDQARVALEVELDAARALELAAKNWEQRKEPADTRVLLEAALAAGKPEAAKAAARFVVDTHAEEPRLIAVARRVLAESR